MHGVRENIEERQLVEEAKRDPTRFSALYELHFDRIYAFVARRVQTREDAEDVTSLVFHRALANIGTFEWRGAPFAAWLIRIARNALVDRWQKASRDQERPSDAYSSEEGLDREPAVEQQLHVAELVSAGLSGSV